jgi:hypothetical protein
MRLFMTAGVRPIRNRLKRELVETLCYAMAQECRKNFVTWAVWGREEKPAECTTLLSPFCVRLVRREGQTPSA